MNNDVVPKTTHEVHREKLLDPAFQRSNKHTFSVSLRRNFSSRWHSTISTDRSSTVIATLT